MATPTLCVDVVLPLAIEAIYTYALPFSMHAEAVEGVQVMVPLGKSKRYTGIVLRKHSAPPEGITLREVLQVVDSRPIVTPLQMQLWQWMADYYLATLGEVYKAAVPSALRLDSDTVLFASEVAVEQRAALSEIDRQLYEVVLQRGGLTLQQALKQVDRRGAMASLQRLQSIGLLRFDERIQAVRPPRAERYLRLSDECRALEWEQLRDDERWRLQRAPAQLAALSALLECSRQQGEGHGGAVLRSLLVKGGGIAPSVLAALVQKGVLVEVQTVESASPSSPGSPSLAPLSPQQLEAYRQLCAPPEGVSVSLLHGVTGSGKTEIYIHLIARALAQGGQALYLVPEIALTTQLVGRIRAAFGDLVGVYHSRTSEAERLALYRALLRDAPLPGGQRVQVVLGARSSLFLPMRRLGLIIVDEEHESSFKQESPAPRYSGRDAAIMLGRLSGARVVLGSATPSVESYFNAKEGRYQLVHLGGRFGPAQLPRVRLLDLARARKTKRIRGHFTHELLEAIQRTVLGGGQVILFQNRRGYAPTLICSACGWTAMCSACDVALTYHQQSRKLQCHYCGNATQPLGRCPQCQADQLSYRGLGTQRIEEELGESLPALRVVRLDLDTTRARHAYQRILDGFAAHRYDVLVGTQMVTKGLDFQRVQLVGVMDADGMLAQQDFRATERAFQLMAQVGGRAGRREQVGEVLIQTRAPRRPVFRWVIQHDYESFYAAAIHERRAVGYPPYWRLISIMASHPRHAVAQAAMERVAEQLHAFPRIRLLGPQAPLVGRVARMHRVQLHIKVPRGVDYRPLRQALRHALSTVRAHRDWASVRFTVDVDPI